MPFQPVMPYKTFLRYFIFLYSLVEDLARPLGYACHSVEPATAKTAAELGPGTSADGGGHVSPDWYA